MKLISIQLCNFRQFYGKTPEIYLANGVHNTTIIHGNNGAGKTTFLNALTWVLYGEFTPGFREKEHLVNKRAITEAEFGASIELRVEINFEHHNKRYNLKRRGYASKNRDGSIHQGKTQLIMQIAGDDGRWYPPSEQPEDVVGKILPASLHRYFFFDGEHIDHLFRQKNTQIGEDTKELIGVKLLDRAVDHLKKALKNLNEELKNIGDIQTQKLLNEQTKIEKEIEQIEERQQEITYQLEGEKKAKNELNERLLTYGKSENFQEKKLELEKREKAVKQNILESRKKLKQTISNQSYKIFLPELRDKFMGMIDALRSKGELPSGIKQDFVEQLLEQGRCICGTELSQDGAHYHHVQSWLNKAGNAQLEEAAIRLAAQMGEVGTQVTQLWGIIDEHQGKINEGRSSQGEIENQLDELKEKLRQSPDEEIKQLQLTIDQIDEKIRQFTLEQGANQQKLDTHRKHIEDIAYQVNRHKMRHDKQILAQRRIHATQDSIERLQEVKNRLETQFRRALELRIQEIFRSISFTPYEPRLRENYQLDLIENTLGVAFEVPASTGENQILSLSFIGAIIDKVREWSEEKNTFMGPDSSTFPMVMDSAFGSLDEIYRRQVASSIPSLANQLVVLVSKTQWRGEVAEEMAKYVGKQYVLVYYSPKPECQEDFIELGGNFYPLVKQSPNQYEYTEIVEVK